MLAVLLFCAILPAIVLAVYGVRGLLEVDTVYEAALQDERERRVGPLRDSLLRHCEQTLNALDTAANEACRGSQWLESSDSCARALQALSGRAQTVVVLGNGKRLFPAPGGETTDSDSPIRGLELLAASGRGNRDAPFTLRTLSSARLSITAAEAHISGAQILVGLDEQLLLNELKPMVSSFNRASPGLSARIVTVGSGRAELPASALTHVSLTPWLPQWSLSIQSSDLAEAGTSGSQIGLQISLLVALVAIVIAGVWISGGALSREVGLARMKSDFVSNVSHELRTPLTTIRIMAEMLALNAVPDDDKKAEYHRNIVSEAERLTRLINNVLDFARIEEGRKKFQFGMGDLGDVIFEVVRIIGDYAGKEGFVISTSVEQDLPATSFDRDAIIQVLINLTANAVKYSGDDKRIEVGARLDRGNIVLWVTDHGPGIGPEELPRLFNKFFRGGEHLTREIGGTGLGLAIVQHIVHAHDGEVSARSTLGEGSTFEIQLPVRQPQQQIGTKGRR